jgi:hypothetical protein
MFKTLLILVLVFTGIWLVKNMDIQDAEYKEINDE